jgi:phage baseplate assembly protein W
VDVAFPYRIDARGRSAEAREEDHVRELIEQLLLTASGERVNRPTFGSGLLDLVFEPGGDAVAAAAEQAIAAALQLWLGERITVEGVDVQGEEERLEVSVRYALRRTEERFATTVVREH